MKQHYHLASGTVTFMQSPGDYATSPAYNTLMPTDSRETDLAALTLLQHGLVAQFRNFVPENIPVVDVVINNIMYLGEFTKEEFEAKALELHSQEQADGTEVHDPNTANPLPN